MKKYSDYYLFDRKNLSPNDYVLGIDEVGRGCWAGILVVCGVLLNGNYYHDLIKDSKKLTSRQRLFLVDDINKNNVRFFIESFDATHVDKYGPKNATKILMTKIVNKLGNLATKIYVDYEKLFDVKYKYVSLKKADEKSFAVATASIIAKWYRDNVMNKLDKQYPNYGFKNHKGYGTKEHLIALKKYGPIFNIHRFSYKPIKTLITVN